MEGDIIVCCLQGEAVPQQERAVRADPEEERADVCADGHHAGALPRSAARAGRDRHEHPEGQVSP